MAETVIEYLENLPDDRRKALLAVRTVIKANLPRGYEEGILYGMICYFIPLSRYPETYNGQPLLIAGLASQKNYMSVYLMGVYGDREIERWFKGAFAEAGKKLDMGKSCVRFKTLDALPLEVIGEAISRVSVDEYIARVEALHGAKKKKRAAKKAAAKKAAKKSTKRAAKESAPKAAKKPAPKAAKKPAPKAAKKPTPKAAKKTRL